MQLFEITDKLSTPEMYVHDVPLENYSITGIKEECCFNEILSFHVLQYVYCDIMHDLLEGVCRYAMLNLLKYLILSKQYFSLESLNLRIEAFQYYSTSGP